MPVSAAYKSHSLFHLQASSQCLAEMISQAHKLFSVSQLSGAAYCESLELQFTHMYIFVVLTVTVYIYVYISVNASLQLLKTLQQVPADMLQVCKFTYLETGDPVPYHELGLSQGGHPAYHESCIQSVHKEFKRKFKGWIHHSTPEKGVDVSYLKPTDGVPLRVWKGVVEIKASPDAVLKKLWIEKYVEIFLTVCSCIVYC